MISEIFRMNFFFYPTDGTFRKDKTINYVCFETFFLLVENFLHYQIIFNFCISAVNTIVPFFKRKSFLCVFNKFNFASSTVYQEKSKRNFFLYFQLAYRVKKKLYIYTYLNLARERDTKKSLKPFKNPSQNLALNLIGE